MFDPLDEGEGNINIHLQSLVPMRFCGEGVLVGLGIMSRENIKKAVPMKTSIGHNSNLAQGGVCRIDSFYQ